MGGRKKRIVGNDICKNICMYKIGLIGGGFA
jgi:hypothetical protein